MLCLGRRKGEAVVINDEIVVTVVSVVGDRVCLGVTAPRHVSVLRKELWEDERRKPLGIAPVPVLTDFFLSHATGKVVAIP